MASRIKSVGKRYPWDKWTDGKPRRAKKGRDYTCTTEGFAATLYTRARRKELSVSVSIPDSKTVEFQFEKPEKK